MTISFNWLKQYIDIKESADKIAEILTDTGLEVEKIIPYSTGGENLKDLIIGEVMECEPHPNADKLKLTKVDIGTEEYAQIVCGAPNVASGQKVVVAPVNTMIYPTDGEPFKIKKAKIRGEVSLGMICAEDEIGIGTDHDGIMVLDTDLPNGTSFSDYLKPYEDTIFEIGLTPNRGDATSHIGVARDLKAFYNSEVKFPEVSAFSVDEAKNEIKVSVENIEACPRYSALVMENITVGESPQWLKDFLTAIGVKTINNVVDITNFVLHECGQPLHAFDADQIKGNEVIVKTLEEKTPFTSLDGEHRKLSANDLMICNKEEGMCIAGVFGGIKSGVTSKTNRIFLESAYFSPDYIRRTSQYHGLKTDAAFRYERGADPEITIYALKRAALLLKELAGARIVSELIDIQEKEIEWLELDVSYLRVDRLIGKVIERTSILKILQSLDFRILDENEEGIKLSVPPYRSDVTREADVIEEILRIYGFNNIEIPKQISSNFLAGSSSKDKSPLAKKLNDLMVARGFFEIMTNSLTRPDYIDLSKSWKQEDNVEILNRLSDELAIMRQSLLFQMGEVAAYNQRHRQSHLKFFELGKTYHKAESGWKEREVMGILFTGDFIGKWWNRAGEKSDFFHLSDVMNKIASMISGNPINKDSLDRDEFDYGLSYKWGEKEWGVAGKVSTKIQKKLGVKGDLFFAELDLNVLQKRQGKAVLYKPVPKFPEVKRDLSLVIDKSVSYNKITEIAESHGKRLLKRMELFDVYEGDKIEEGKKAYAVSFLLQDAEKTLSDKQIDKVMSKLMEAYKRDLNAIIRM